MKNTFLSLPSSELSCSIGTCFFSLSKTSFILFIRSRSLALATFRWYLLSLGFFGYFSFLFFVTFFISVSSLFLTEVFLSDLDLSERLLTIFSEPLSVCSAMILVTRFTLWILAQRARCVTSSHLQHLIPTDSSRWSPPTHLWPRREGAAVTRALGPNTGYRWPLGSAHLYTDSTVQVYSTVHCTGERLSDGRLNYLPH